MSGTLHIDPLVPPNSARCFQEYIRSYIQRTTIFGSSVLVDPYWAFPEDSSEALARWELVGAVPDILFPFACSTHVDPCWVLPEETWEAIRPF